MFKEYLICIGYYRNDLKFCFEHIGIDVTEDIDELFENVIVEVLCGFPPSKRGGGIDIELLEQENPAVASKIPAIHNVYVSVIGKYIRNQIDYTDHSMLKDYMIRPDGILALRYWPVDEDE